MHKPVNVNLHCLKKGRLLKHVYLLNKTFKEIWNIYIVYIDSRLEFCKRVIASTTLLLQNKWRFNKRNEFLNFFLQLQLSLLPQSKLKEIPAAIYLSQSNRITAMWHNFEKRNWLSRVWTAAMAICIIFALMPLRKSWTVLFLILPYRQLF